MSSYLVGPLVIYLLLTVAIGVWAGKRVKTSTDYIAASRSLPIYIVIATVFATWFGSETVLGTPSSFIEGGLLGVVADPFGAALCLVLVGLFFAVKLYRLNINSIAAYYKIRYDGRVELLTTIAIMLSYIGWVAAQIAALGLVFNIVTLGAVSVTAGMLLGAGIVLIYTLWGGMWAVALTDFVQMISIVVGLIIIAVVLSAKIDGGATTVIAHAHSNNMLTMVPDWTWAGVLGFIGALVTLGFGSIPQQDVFQRVMSAKNENTARNGAVAGGLLYLLFALLPLFIVYCAVFIDPVLLQQGMSSDTQRILPSLIMQHTPVVVQVLFFGAVLSAVMSTASGTLLAPATVFVENIVKPWRARAGLTLSDAQYLLLVRLSVLAFAGIVLVYAIFLSDKNIFQMVEDAYKVTLVAAFVPLAAGLYWQRANTNGALCSIAMGLSVWLLCEYLSRNLAEASAWYTVVQACPAQLAGLLAALLGMLLGSLLSNNVKD